MIGRAAARLSQNSVARSVLSVPSSILQRQCACGQHKDGGECDECKEKARILRRSAFRPGGSASIPPDVHRVLQSGGQPLDRQTRSFHEPRFGRDFSHVRLHTDGQAARAAQSVDARAFTVGRDVVFGAGEYHPDTLAGRRLLAHELTHVAQQERSSTAAIQRLTIGSPSDPAEREAESIATAIAWDRPFAPISHSSLGLRRQQTQTTPAAGGMMPAPAAMKSDGASLCASNADETALLANTSFCHDSSFSGLFHGGFSCYREIPTGSGCPPGKHICFKCGTCEPGETHTDDVSPKVKRGAKGNCDIEYSDKCSLLHFIKDVVPWRRVAGAGLGALLGGIAGSLSGVGAGLGIGLGALLGGALAGASSDKPPAKPLPATP